MAAASLGVAIIAKSDLTSLEARLYQQGYAFVGKVAVLGSLALCLYARPVLGQTASSVQAMTYAAAQARLLEVSDAIDAAEAAVDAAEARQKAVQSLGRPDIDIEAQMLDFQKTLYLPLGSLAPVANAFGIADPLIFRVRRFVSRPTVTATMPLYAGGQIAAAKASAASKVALETAARDDVEASNLVQLARLYFGRQLAGDVHAIRQKVVAGITEHVAAARALEREQQIAPVQRLQAEAALEEAKREADKSAADLAAAELALAGLLRVQQAVLPATALDVPTGSLPPVDEFIEAALDRHPAVKRMAATVKLATAAVSAEKAQTRPTVYALAQYNLDRQDTLVTDPDFIFGVGVKYRLAAGLGRRSAVAAAHAARAQAEAGEREARIQIETGVRVAYTQARAAQNRFSLFGQTMAAADTALRMARLAFAEQQGTSRDVTDAQLAVGRVQIEKARAAYDYVLALATLLQISGQPQRLPDYLASVQPKT